MLCLKLLHCFFNLKINLFLLKCLNPGLSSVCPNLVTGFAESLWMSVSMETPLALCPPKNNYPDAPRKLYLDTHGAHKLSLPHVYLLDRLINCYYFVFYYWDQSLRGLFVQMGTEQSFLHTFPGILGFTCPYLTILKLVNALRVWDRKLGIETLRHRKRGNLYVKMFMSRVQVAIFPWYSFLTINKCSMCFCI